jgi:glycosyltransferase involved in cell wall biosynthesis
VDAVRHDGDRFRHDHLGGHRGLLVMVHGRVARKKGIDLLMRALARADPDGSAMLAVVGPDDEALTPALIAERDRLGLNERVVFTGPLYGDAMLAALDAADVWALTSHTENFGNAVLEAMAAGRPTLVSEHVNLSTDAAEADAALVTTLDPEDIAQHLRRLLDDPALRERFGARAEAFSRRYDWSRVGPQLAEMYEKVACGAPARASAQPSAGAAARA